MAQEALQLQAEPKQETGTGVSRAIRRQGRVPAIIYGGQQPEQGISLDYTQVTKAYLDGYFTSKIVEIEVAGKKIKVLPREVQLDPVSDKIVHVDFQRLESGKKITVSVKVNYINADKSPGIKRGGTLNIVRRSFQVNCAPDHIPESVTVDLTGANIGHRIHISHLNLSKEMELVIKDRDFTLATIAGRGKSMEETTATATTEAATAAPAAATAAAPAANNKG